MQRLRNLRKPTTQRILRSTIRGQPTDMVVDPMITYDAVCKECNTLCHTITVDHGIGAYEYWGSVGYDTQEVTVSDCCEADYDDT
jgi:hypothetical protein